MRLGLLQELGELCAAEILIGSVGVEIIIARNTAVNDGAVGVRLVVGLRVLVHALQVTATALLDGVRLSLGPGDVKHTETLADLVADILAAKRGSFGSVSGTKAASG